MAPIMIATFISFFQIISAKSGSFRTSTIYNISNSQNNDQHRSLNSDTTPFECNSDSDCSYNGQCSYDKKFCICNPYYTTNPEDNKKQCNYEQKSRLTAFFLELFICGTGQMYLGNISSGIPQFLFTYCFGIISFIAGLGFCSCDKENDKIGNWVTTKRGGLIIFSIVMCFLGWSIADAIKIALGVINDSKNVPTFRNM
jgi:TM2 domain-containing membrane protein YozV